MLTTAKRLLLITGYRCNNNCVFCSADSYTNRFINRTTKELARDIIVHSAHYDRIVLIGGEFTIRDDAVALVSLCRSHGYKEISLETNGRLFADRAFADRLIDAGLTDVSFSIHGATAATHDRLTRVKGSFSQAIRGLKNAGRHKITLNANFVATRYNLPELPHFAAMMSGLGFISRIVVIFVRPPMRDQNDRQLLELVPKYTEALGVFRRTHAAGRLSFQYLPVCLSAGLEVIRQQQKKSTFNLSVHSKQRKDLYSSLMSEFMFPAKCGPCAEKKKCCGITKGYFRLYGADELRPK